MPRTVLLVGYPGVQALDLVGPFEVFTGASLYADARTAGTGYDARIVAVGGTPVATGTGLTLVADPLPDPGAPVDTVVLPGGAGTESARHDAELIDWIAAVSARARRVVSVCTGAVLAAEAGAELAFSYQGEALKKRVDPLAGQLGSDIVLPCDVGDEASIDALFTELNERWGGLDFLVHAIGFSDKNELRGRYVDTSRANFALSMDISVYSFTAV
ncbi:SDR family oxidoreductase, partial [Mycolicibacterium poriferae]|uniref:SDR family oxidoreductase n=1 Tax=Mycolicibacterium poriferae TaxID=39694 RepID=UPI0024BA5AB7